MSDPLTSALVINSVSNDSNYKYISFTTIGNTSLTVNYDIICDILLVGGGGQVTYYTNIEMI